ncbi:ribonuclease Oy [Camponotus floridanus]|uniref:ribonuclease Oy n=1 Tax=Camponotus floridanus TaxID=104421 RepID=UPI000DC68FD5|nr:ribonuclease Oy [Camponotus floridanus]
MWNNEKRWWWQLQKKVVGESSTFSFDAGSFGASIYFLHVEQFFLNKMAKYIILYIFLLCSLVYLTHGRKSKKPKSNNFDVVIFTQQWPLTACFIWEESSKHHTCLLPKRDEWTIHGIWPTKYNTKGPEYCNTSLRFNASVLVPLESQLKENWMDIHNGSNPYSFWKHEWEKHGTCAIKIKALGNEYKYFEKGLTFLNSYNMIDILPKANIFPGQKYMVENMLIGIQQVLNKRCQIICVQNKKTGESYVSEIRLCFDKALKLIDCDGIYEFPTNCNKLKQITYPSSTPHNYRAIQI